jgi:DNA-binding CsgD family transcriptional regulator
MKKNLVSDERPVLTSRELECLQLLARGRSNDGISKELKISLPTVALHLRNARIKLGASTRENAVALAITRGMITV